MSECKKVAAKHASFKEKPEAERLPNMGPESLYRTIKEIETPRSGVTSAERRVVFTLLYRHIKEDNDRARRFAKKLEGHRKLMRYERRAVNQIRKAAQIKKITKRTQGPGTCRGGDKRFYRGLGAFAISCTTIKTTNAIPCNYFPRINHCSLQS